MDDMNGMLAQGYRCYEELRAMDDMNNSKSWAQGSRWFE